MNALSPIQIDPNSIVVKKSNPKFISLTELFYSLLKENTRVAYKSDIEHFLNNITSINFENTLLYFQELVDFGYERFSKRDKHLGTYKYTLNTIIRKKAAISKYIEFMYENKLFEFNYMRTNTFSMFFKKLAQQIELQNVKGYKPDPTHLKQHEIRNIINSFDENDLIELRNKIILCLGYYAGLRRSEMVRLEWQDIKDDRIVIRAAKSGTAEVMLHPNLKETLDAAKEKEEYGRYPNVIISLHHSHVGEKLNSESLNKLVKQVCREHGIKRIITAHTLRHTTAIAMIENSGDVSKVAMHLRHQSFDTTNKYFKSRELVNNSAVLSL